MFSNIIFSIIISIINTIIYGFMNKNIHLENKFKDYGIFFSLTFITTFIGMMFLNNTTNTTADISGGSSISSSNVGLKIHNSSKPPF